MAHRNADGCVLSSTVRLFQVVSSTTLILEEGDSPQSIEIKPYMPPAFLCDSMTTPADCSFVIDAQVQAHPDDLTCLRGGQVNQVVLGSLDSPGAAFCGLVITVDNWQEQHMLPVEAKRDMVVDGDKTRQLDIAVNITSPSGQLDTPFSIASLQVRVCSPFGDLCGVFWVFFFVVCCFCVCLLV